MYREYDDLGNIFVGSQHNQYPGGNQTLVGKSATISTKPVKKRELHNNRGKPGKSCNAAIKLVPAKRLSCNIANNAGHVNSENLQFVEKQKNRGKSK